MAASIIININIMRHSFSPLHLPFTLLFIAASSLTPFEAHKLNSPVLPEAPKRYNPIDGCWRRNFGVAKPQQLADCAKGYGAEAHGGNNGQVYVVTDPSDDPVNPKKGTLRYGVIQYEPLWITFQKDMDIRLKGDLLMMNSGKTIDGRGAKVKIGNGPCITIENATHVIVHGLIIKNCKRTKPGLVRINPDHVLEAGSDGDGIRIVQSTHIWVDHCYFYGSEDGLIDVSCGSDFVTLSNNYFSHQTKVMLLGHSDDFSGDRGMKVTVMFNYFGPQLVSRMPRTRFGYFHIVNNKYDKWLLYAIGGSKNPTILSQGNYYTASDNPHTKEVTWRKDSKELWGKWSWTSTNDAFQNGAYFNASGKPWEPHYSKAQKFEVAPANQVPELTQDAGPLPCLRSKPC